MKLGSLQTSMIMETGRVSVRNSAGYTAFLLLKLSSLAGCTGCDSELRASLDNVERFVQRFFNRSVLEIFFSLGKGKIGRFFTFDGNKEFPVIRNQDLDLFFGIKDFFGRFGEVNDVVVVQVSREIFESNTKTFLEFCDSEVEIYGKEYQLCGIVCKKEYNFNVIVEGTAGVVYYKMHSNGKFDNWGDALFHAFEGDFLPHLMVFVKCPRVRKIVVPFMTEESMEAIENYLMVQKTVIKSVKKINFCKSYWVA